MKFLSESLYIIIGLLFFVAFLNLGIVIVRLRGFSSKMRMTETGLGDIVRTERLKQSATDQTEKNEVQDGSSEKTG